MTIQWEKAVSGALGKELSARLIEAGIGSLDDLRAKPDTVQSIVRDVFLPEVGKLLKAASSKVSETGEVKWAGIRGYNAEFEDLLYANGIFTLEEASGNRTFVARLIAKWKGADGPALRRYAAGRHQSVTPEPVEIEQKAEPPNKEEVENETV